MPLPQDDFRQTVTGRRRCAALFFATSLISAALSSCAATFEPGEIPPTPQRPKISKNTRTTAAETIELEAGLHVDPADFVDTPITLKYGVTERLEYILETSPIRVYDYPGENESGIGDLAFGMRHRFDDGEDGGPSFAFELVGKIPTSDRGDERRNPGLGTGGRDPRLSVFTTGGTDVRLAGMAEQKIGEFDVAGYVALNSLDSTFSGTIYELLVATHGALPITESDTVFVELAGTITESVPDKFLLQGGLYRRIAANMTADAALGIGLNGDSPAVYFMVGVTTNFGYLR